jgi:hypothetical protein
MRSKLVLALTVVAASFVTSFCLAMYSVADRGLWPDAWPEHLERLRAQARTLDHGQFVVYEIPFHTRAEFENAWPHLLALKSGEAPLVLLAGPNDWLGQPLAAGVRLRCPETGSLVTVEDKTYRVYPAGAESSVPGGKFLRIGPPWPDEVTSPSGAPPEYVSIEDGRWKACDPKDSRGSRLFPVWRARIDIELIVDGNLVDLNRIPLPADTPIIDKRFEAASAPKADAGSDDGAPKAGPPARAAPGVQAAPPKRPSDK